MRISLICLALCALTLPSCARNGSDTKAPAVAEPPKTTAPAPTTPMVKPRIKLLTTYGPIVP